MVQEIQTRFTDYNGELSLAQQELQDAVSNAKKAKDDYDNCTGFAILKARPASATLKTKNDVLEEASAKVESLNSMLAEAGIQLDVIKTSGIDLGLEYQELAPISDAASVSSVVVDDSAAVHSTGTIVNPLPKESAAASASIFPPAELELASAGGESLKGQLVVTLAKALLNSL